MADHASNLPTGPSATLPSSRAAALRELLRREVVNVAAVKALVFEGGIPEEDKGLRAIVWQVSLYTMFSKV